MSIVVDISALFVEFEPFKYQSEVIGPKCSKSGLKSVLPPPNTLECFSINIRPARPVYIRFQACFRSIEISLNLIKCVFVDA